MAGVRETLDFRTPESAALDRVKSVRYIRRFRRVFRTRLESRSRCRDPDANHSADVAPGSAFGPECGDLSTIDVSTRSAESLSARTRRRDAGANAVANQFSVKFRDAGENPEHEPAVWRGRVHAFMQRDELNPERVEFTERIYKQERLRAKRSKR